MPAEARPPLIRGKKSYTVRAGPPDMYAKHARIEVLLEKRAFYAKGVWDGGEPTVRTISWAHNGGIAEAWGLAKAETRFDEALNAANSPAGHTQ
eukprot:1483293-Alexandrium_andersonii.AAC.1